MEPVIDVSEYDATYAKVGRVLKVVSIRLMVNDSRVARYLWDLFYWFEFANIFAALIAELAYLVPKAQAGTFEDAVAIFRMIPCIGYVVMALTKSYKIVYQRPTYENLIKELREMWPRGRLPSEDHRVLKTSIKDLHKMVNVFYWSNHVLVSLFLVPPYVAYLRRGGAGERQLPFLYLLPFDQLADGVYEVMLVLEAWHGLLTISLMLSGDLLFCVLVSHLSTQLQLLSTRVERHHGEVIKECTHTQRETENEGLTASEWESRHQKELVKIVLRHRALMRLADDVESLFSFSMLVTFINSSIVLCFCGFCCAVVEKWNQVIYKQFLATALFETWLLCWYGQRLLDASEGVATAVYKSGWYESSRKIKSSLFIILVRSQRCLKVTTYGFHVISLASFSTICKTSWSYFTLLLNLYKRH